MMRHILLFGATALFGLSFGGLAMPQDAPEGGEEASERSRYHVEVIVFANADFDPTEELFDYVAGRRHIEVPLALPAPALRPVPETVWTYPEYADADADTEPVPGIVRFGGSVVAAGRPFPVPRQAPSDRPRLELEGVRRPPPERRDLPRLALGPDGLASPVSEVEARALPRILITVAKTFVLPPLLELPDPPAEAQVDPFAVGPLVLEPLVAAPPADETVLYDATAAADEPEPPRRYAEELDREFAFVPAGSATERRIRYRVLGAGELKLADAYARLQRLTGYRPLLHAGWSQEGLGESEALPLPLTRLGTANPAGTIQLHLQRFLHLTLDLDYRFALRRRPGTSSGRAAPPLPSSGLSGVAARSDELKEIELAPRYYIEEERRTRNGDVNYFDHPAFGVLVVVTRAPEAPEATDQETQDGRPAA